MELNHDARLQHRALAGLGETAEQTRTFAIAADGSAVAPAGVSRDGQVDGAGLPE